MCNSHGDYESLSFPELKHQSHSQYLAVHNLNNFMLLLFLHAKYVANFCFVYCTSVCEGLISQISRGEQNRKHL